MAYTNSCLVEQNFGMIKIKMGYILHGSIYLIIIGYLANQRNS